MTLHIILILTLLGGFLWLAKRYLSPDVAIRAVAGSLLVLNTIVALGGLGTALTYWLATPEVAEAAPQTQEEGGESGGEGEGGLSGGVALGAALAIGLASIGAGIAVGIGSAAAIGAITEKPEVLGRTLIFVGLGEGIAIYGLIVSFIILTGGF